jgi:hypothetical protein
MWLVYKLHALVVAAVWGLARLLGRGVWSFILAVFALFGEEFRRWVGLVAWGVLLVGAGKATLNYAPPGTRQPLLLTVLLLLGIWALAVRRAAHLTRTNNLRMVRQRQAFRELSGDVRDVRGRMTEGLARATQGTPLGQVFRPNRERTAKAEADNRAAQRRADAERAAAVAEERRRDGLADLEPNPYTWERT